MKRKIQSVEQSPFNGTYFITLECGHTVTRQRLSQHTRLLSCPECSLSQTKHSNTGVQPTEYSR